MDIGLIDDALTANTLCSYVFIDADVLIGVTTAAMDVAGSRKDNSAGNRDIPYALV